jgi:hypothetical protein
MAIQKQFEENVTKAKELELELYQNSLKNKINMLGSFFSIVLILLGLFLLVSGLFGIVNVSPPIQIQEDTATNSTDNVAINNEILIEKGDIGEGLSTAKVEAGSASATLKAMETEEHINRTHKWRATDYEKGEIGIGRYEVKLGDTLWEISEAVYGSGFLWHKILDANSSSIGFLPNGSQALIIPGQVLVINK